MTISRFLRFVVLGAFLTASAYYGVQLYLDKVDGSVGFILAAAGFASVAVSRIIGMMAGHEDCAEQLSD